MLLILSSSMTALWVTLFGGMAEYTEYSNVLRVSMRFESVYCISFLKDFPLILGFNMIPYIPCFVLEYFVYSLPLLFCQSSSNQAQNVL